MGNRVDSTVYISKKLEKAKEVGVESVLLKLGAECDEFELEKLIERLNNDPHIDGIIVQVNLKYDLYKCSAVIYIASYITCTIFLYSFRWIPQLKWMWKASLTRFDQKKM